MNFKSLSVKSWEQLDSSGNKVSGYVSMNLSLLDEPSGLHIFKDEKGRFHFAIEAPNTNEADIEDPNINGLNLSINHYRLNAESVNTFIDIRCDMVSYLEEFTEVTKEIAKNIFDRNEKPSEVVNRIIRNWKSFWASRSGLILSDEKLIGLICELKVLQRLLQINSSNAIMSWSGPNAERHDFNFIDWNFEVKGTRNIGVIHTINGIDQLKSLPNKQLAFISFLISITDIDSSTCLPAVISEIHNTLQDRPDLIILFNNLLAQSGYSPIYDEHYRKFKIEFLESLLFEVNNSFPSLTTEDLREPLNARISAVRYNISLEGLIGRKFEEINLGEYFY